MFFTAKVKARFLFLSFTCLNAQVCQGYGASTACLPASAHFKSRNKIKNAERRADMIHRVSKSIGKMPAKGNLKSRQHEKELLKKLCVMQYRKGCRWDSLITCKYFHFNRCVRSRVLQRLQEKKTQRENRQVRYCDKPHSMNNRLGHSEMGS